MRRLKGGHVTRRVNLVTEPPPQQERSGTSEVVVVMNLM